MDKLAITIDTYNKNSQVFNFTVQEYIINMSKYLNLFLHNLKGKKILDAGCGNGVACKYFEMKGFNTYGIDLSDKLLEIAKKYSPNTEFYKMDFRNITLKGKFDGIWANASLVHLSKKEIKIFLKQCYRLLSRSGIIFIGIRQGQGTKMLKLKEIKGERLFYYYSELEIQKLLIISGFQKIFSDKRNDMQRKTTWLNLLYKKI